MNRGEKTGGKQRVLGALGNGQTFLPSLATRERNDTTSATKTNGAPDKENNPTTMATGAHSRKQSASSLSDNMAHSPEVSRIPRPTSNTGPRTRRRSLTLEEAFDLAEHRRAIGSPSPAPRPTRQMSSSSDHRPLPHLFSQKPIDLGRLGKARPGSSLRREGTLSSKDSFGSSTRKGDESDSELDRKMKQFQEDKKLMDSLKGEKKGLFIKKPELNPAGFKAASARGSSNGILGNNTFGNSNNVGNAPRQSWGNSHDNDPNWIKRFEPALRVAAEEDARRGLVGMKRKSPDPILAKPSAEHHSPLAIPRPATAGPLRSPDKSYAWQIDEDFTAGDLQVSNSPPVGFGRSNTKLDELRNLENDAEQQYPVEKRRFTPQRTNTKLEELLRREREAERRYPSSRTEEPTTESVVEPPNGARSIPSFSAPHPPKTDGESNRVKESGDPAKKALNTTKLNVFRDEQAPRLPSPEAQRTRTFAVPEWPSSPVSPEGRSQSQEHKFGELEGEKIPDTPVTIYRRTFPKQTSNEQNEPQRNGVPPAESGKGFSFAKENSHDLLRRLARASSKSPSPSPVQEKPTDKAQEDNKAALYGTGEQDKHDKRVVPNSNKGPEVNGAPPTTFAGGNKSSSFAKPIVGFTGIPRSASTKSVLSAQSRGSADPTSRIEAEMNLFALADNMSERGSNRAPSPRPESGFASEEVDTTPRPPKIDPLSMPTPQVTGAYVETPVKLEQPDVKVGGAAFEREFLSHRRRSELQKRDPSTSPRATKSDGQRERVRSISMSKLRRSRSLPRHNLPLKNSVKPPTVKEDLKQIHMLNNIEDSTLEDLTDLIATSNNPEELEHILKHGVPESDDMDDLTFEEQLKRFDQFGRSLNAGLAGIRQAKKGIERLENRVSHAEKPATAVKTEDSDNRVGTQDRNAKGYLPVPRPLFFHTQPKFKPTLLGFLLLLLSSWYLLENAFYERWGRQYVCYRGSPCHYDVDDPDYGYVVPVKLDEWITGGMIRPHAAHWMEEISDYYADAQDWWTGTDIRQIDWRAIRDPDMRRNHFRRMDKKALWPEWNPDPEMMPMIQALEHQRLAEEAAEAPDGVYYGVYDNPFKESMNRDDFLAGERQSSIRWF
ncbi:hypothetical protein VP1G_07639 [Cytospora mali]|uniref:Uncharacterized protein n=1 Tax=Cytospora mali TaxID=578113 RepID=A0A194V901_CYTMA|nr:hypothetical protein VP1G_07639 [Valsa mali var. pyri (nom. inval.)]